MDQYQNDPATFSRARGRGRPRKIVAENLQECANCATPCATWTDAQKHGIHGTRCKQWTLREDA